MKIAAMIVAGCITLSCAGQKSFYRGALVIGANFETDGNITSQHYLSGPENSAQTLNGTAPSSDYSVTTEVGLFNWLGVGVVGRIDNYLIQQNEVTQTSPTEGAIDIGATANIHFLRWKHFDLLGGYDFGFSRLTYTYNNPNTDVNSTSISNGTWADIHVTGRIYAKRLGVGLSFYVPSTNYSNFQSSNMSPGDYTINYWKSTGYGLSFSLVYRIL